jgi:hypothetical protein
MAAKEFYRRLCDMVRMYWALGYAGVFSDVELREQKPSLVQLRLEVARLEELRLNRSGLVHTYETLDEPDESSALLPLGFLRGATLNRNAAFEHQFLKCTDTDVPDTAARKAKKMSVIWAINAARDVTLTQRGLTLVDKLLLVALHSQRLVSDVSILAVATACEEVVVALARLHLALNKPFATRICKPLTVEVIKGVLAKLAKREYVTPAFALAEVSTVVQSLFLGVYAVNVHSLFCRKEMKLSQQSWTKV